MPSTQSVTPVPVELPPAHRTPGRLQATLELVSRTAAETAADAGLSSGWCIAAAGVTQNVLTRLGIPGVRVVGLDVGACNDAGWALFCARVPFDRWPAHAWADGVEATDGYDADGWDGHAAAYVPSRADGRTAWVVDPSAGQFTQPEDGLVVEPFAARVPADFLMGDAVPIPMIRGALLLRRNPRLRRIDTELAATQGSLALLAEEIMARLAPTLATAVA